MSLAWQLVTASGNRPNKNTTFPIQRVAAQPNRHGKIPCPQISPGVTSQIRRLLAPIQPYQRETEFAQHPLWVVAQLNNIDKHQLLTFGGYTLSPAYLVTGSGSGEWKTLRILEDGAELGLVDSSDMGVKAKMTLSVCFQATWPGVEPRPIVHALTQSLQFIREHVLASFERAVFV